MIIPIEKQVIPHSFFFCYCLTFGCVKHLIRLLHRVNAAFISIVAIVKRRQLCLIWPADGDIVH